MKLLCWYFGCKPHKHHKNYDFIPCDRCGCEAPYGDLVGDTKHAKVKGYLNYYLFRKWYPEKCRECGKRHGDHYGCLPF